MRSNPLFQSLRVSFFLALLTVSSLGTAQSNAALQLPTASDPCRFGSRVIPAPPKTLTRIMPSRYNDLTEAAEGFQRSRVALVAFGSDGFQPAGYSDDPGLYYFVPAISRGFHESLPNSLSQFLVVPLVFCFLLGAVGFAFLFETLAARLISTTALAFLFAVVFHIGDIYVFEAAVPVLLIPWFLVLVRRQQPSALFIAFMGAAGLVFATTYFIRTTAVLPTAVFLLLGTVWYLRASAAWKLALLAVLAIGMVVPAGFFSRVLRQRDNFLLSHSSLAQVDLERHTVWHLVYFGLGYLKLPAMPAVCDEASKAKAYSIDPSATYLSSTYDHILHHEVMRLFADHPATVLAALLAKALTTLGVALLFSNIGLIAAWFYPKEKSLERIFACSLAVAAAPVILVVPLWQYQVGVISIATIYGAVSVAHALQVRAAQRNIDPATNPTLPAYRQSARRDTAFSA